MKQESIYSDLQLGEEVLNVRLRVFVGSGIFLNPSSRMTLSFAYVAAITNRTKKFVN